MAEDKPATKSKRFFKLAGMTASVMGDYAKTQIKSLFLSEEEAEKQQKESHSRSGSRIAETLGELKGAVMKVGQMATLAQDILPKELASALTSLQKEAPPMAYSVIAEQIEAELGAPPEALFRYFSKEPFASASIGQVHRAVTDDGREVIVKVQYPGVDGAVDSDLAHLKVALRASGIVKMSKEEMNRVFGEIRDRLVEELDYCIEADNVRLFREHHKDDEYVVVPDVIGERSSQRVLTLTYEPGDHLNQLQSLGYSQELRNTLGLNLFRIFLSQILDLRVVHADPNPANMAFRPDGTIVLYDFGCVKRLPDHFIQAYRDIIHAALVEDYVDVERCLNELSILREGGPAIEHSYYKEWRDVILLPYTAAPEFDYGNTNIHEEIVKRIPGVLKRMDSFQSSPDMIFVNRVVGGHYGTLRHLKSKGPFLDLVKAKVYESRAKDGEDKGEDEEDKGEN